MGLVKRITSGFTFRQVLDHRLFKHSIVYTISELINKAIPFLLLKLITDYIPPREFGILQNYAAIIPFLTSFMAFGAINIYAVNFYKKPKEEQAKFLFNLLSLTASSIVILVVIVLLMSNIVYDVYNLPRKWQILALIHLLFLTTNNILLNIFRLENKPINYGIYNVSRTLVEIALSVYFLVILKYGWEGRALGIIISYVVYGSFAIIFLIVKGYIRIGFQKAFLTEQLKFGIPVFLSTLPVGLKDYLTHGFITKFHGTSDNGLFAIALRFGLLIMVLFYSFMSAYSPMVYERLSNEQEFTRRRLVRISYIFFIGLIAFVLIFNYLSNWFIIGYLKPEWKEALPYIFWVLLSNAFIGIGQVFMTFIYFSKQTKYLLWISLAINFLYIVLAYLVLKNYSAINIVYVLCLTNFIYLICTWYVSHIVCPMPWFSIDFHKKITK